jgi:hypothetical protein
LSPLQKVIISGNGPFGDISIILTFRSGLKTALSKRYNYGRNIEKHIAGKTDFIINVLVKARQENKEIEYEYFR